MGCTLSVPSDDDDDLPALAQNRRTRIQRKLPRFAQPRSSYLHEETKTPRKNKLMVAHTLSVNDSNLPSISNRFLHSSVYDAKIKQTTECPAGIYGYAVNNLRFKRRRKRGAFEYFPNLPMELRLMIWVMMFPGPRHVDMTSPCNINGCQKMVRERIGLQHSQELYERDTDLPVTLWVTHESREETLRHYHIAYPGNHFASGIRAMPFCVDPSIDTVFFSCKTNWECTSKWLLDIKTNDPEFFRNVKQIEFRDCSMAEAVPSMTITMQLAHLLMRHDGIITGGFAIIMGNSAGIGEPLFKSLEKVTITMAQDPVTSFKRSSMASMLVPFWRQALNNFPEAVLRAFTDDVEIALRISLALQQRKFNMKTPPKVVVRCWEELSPVAMV